MADNRTEPATPKRREEARNRGQVARSADLVSAAVAVAGIATIALTAPAMLGRGAAVVSEGLSRAGHPRDMGRAGLGGLGVWAIESVALMAGPIAVACVCAGVLANVVQNRPHLSGKPLSPQWSRIDPIAGFRRLFGTNSLVEGAKTIAKTCLVGAAATLAVWPRLDQLQSLVGMPPGAALELVGQIVLRTALFALAAMTLLAVADFAWQRRRFAKSLRMTKEEVKLEQRQSDVAPEVRSAVRRRQYALARQRMMSEVATADVVVTNPTHYAVALRYDGSKSAPEVVAKGADLVAEAIRDAAAEAGVPVLANPPLARALHREVEIGQQIPEHFFQAVAEVLAYVYRLAGRRR